MRGGTEASRAYQRAWYRKRVEAMTEEEREERRRRNRERYAARIASMTEEELAAWRARRAAQSKASRFRKAKREAGK